MRRHDLDWVSLIAGLVFLGFAAVYAVAALTDLTIDGRFVWPIVFVALGAAGVATAVTATAREERTFAESEKREP
ncbi:MAG TPA: hypothetical protein VLV82_04840 [Candidatus Angelobacter sp.]|nr:hypothetical protein [Candidatus Angelobacter sp.]